MKLHLYNSRKKLFLTSNSKFDETSKIDLILSPEFYWTRIFEIPVKNKKKAKKALPILLEDSLPKKEFEYMCQKITDNTYMAFAFNNDDIIEAIANSGLSNLQINNVYLAQGQMLGYESFQIEGQYFEYYNKILIKAPYKLHDNYIELSPFINNKLNIHKVNLKFYTNLIKRKYLETSFVILFMICILNIFKYVQYNNTITKNETYLTNIKNEHNLPKSNLLFISMLNDLKDEFLINKELKNNLKYILSYPNKLNGATIENLSYKNQKLIVSFKNTEEQILEEYINKKIKKFSLSLKNKLIQIEVKI